MVKSELDLFSEHLHQRIPSPLHHLSGAGLVSLLQRLYRPLIPDLTQAPGGPGPYLLVIFAEHDLYQGLKGFVVAYLSQGSHGGMAHLPFFVRQSGKSEIYGSSDQVVVNPSCPGSVETMEILTRAMEEVQREQEGYSPSTEEIRRSKEHLRRVLDEL